VRNVGWIFRCAGSFHPARDPPALSHGGDARSLVHGKILSRGAPHDHRLISVITIENRKTIHRRDYMDSLATGTALIAPPSLRIRPVARYSKQKALPTRSERPTMARTATEVL
jgi:hypothetical protein